MDPSESTFYKQCIVDMMQEEKHATEPYSQNNKLTKTAPVVPVSIWRFKFLFISRYR